MQTILAVPGPIGFPARPCFGKVMVLVAVEFFCLVAAYKRLDIRFVLRALGPGIFQVYIQEVGSLAETVCPELRAPVYPQG